MYVYPAVGCGACEALGVGAGVGVGVGVGVCVGVGVGVDSGVGFVWLGDGALGEGAPTKSGSVRRSDGAPAQPARTAVAPVASTIVMMMRRCAAVRCVCMAFVREIMWAPRRCVFSHISRNDIVCRRPRFRVPHARG